MVIRLSGFSIYTFSYTDQTFNFICSPFGFVRFNCNVMVAEVEYCCCEMFDPFVDVIIVNKVPIKIVYMLGVEDQSKQHRIAIRVG